MKLFKEFLLETQAVTKDIEQLADICRKITKYISKKIGLPFGLIQQAFSMVEKPEPHICFNSSVILDELPENDRFLLGEIKNTFIELAKDYKIKTHIITKDESIKDFGDTTSFYIPSAK